MDPQPNVMATDARGQNIMHYCCKTANAGCFQLLTGIEELDIIDSFSSALQTPLMLAIQSRNVSFIALVLEASANPFYNDVLRRTALDYAQMMNDANQQELVRQIEISMQQWRD